MIVSQTHMIDLCAIKIIKLLLNQYNHCFPFFFYIYVVHSHALGVVCIYILE